MTVGTEAGEREGDMRGGGADRCSVFKDAVGGLLVLCEVVEAPIQVQSG